MIINLLLVIVKSTGASISAFFAVFIFSMNVTNFVLIYNPQITKARIINLYKSNITLNSGLSMLVGISEAIRLLFIIFLNLKPFFADNHKEFSLYLNNFISRITNLINSLRLILQTVRNFIVIFFLGAISEDQSFSYSLYHRALLYIFLIKSNFELDTVISYFEFNSDSKSDSKSNYNSYPYSESNPNPYFESDCNFDSGTSIDNSYNDNLKDSDCKNKLSKESKRFNQWLAGLIDGDGCFQLSKKGYASLEIVMQTRDKNCLYQIKQRFGGSVKLRSGLNYLRYRLHHKQGILNIIKALNGEIRNPTRLLQLNKICERYNIPLMPSVPLTYENGWLSGIMDSDGSIYLNEKSAQMYITVGQNNNYLLDLLCNLYGGTVYIEKNSFK
jgi:LAGLIDADG endonuclease